MALSYKDKQIEGLQIQLDGTGKLTDVIVNLRRTIEDDTDGSQIEQRRSISVLWRLTAAQRTQAKNLFLLLAGLV